MKKTLFLICVGITLAAASCKKDDNKTTTPVPTGPRSEIIIGTWSMSQYGVDENDNGVSDDGEAVSVFGVYKRIFNADGTGKDTISTNQNVALNFTWSLQDNDNTIRMVKYGDTINFAIKEMTGAKLVSLDQSTSPGTWNILTK